MIYKIINKINDGKVIASILEFSLGDKLKFWWIFLLLPVLKYLPFMNISFNMPLTFKGMRIIVNISSSTDFAVIKEIFIDKEYEIKGTSIPTTIIDLGANTGFSVIYWKLMYPTTQIHAYEPDPSTFVKLEKNVSKMDNIFLYNEAVGSDEGLKEFYAHKSNISSSFGQRDGISKKIMVPTITLDKAIERMGKVDLLKFDTEGAEFSIFSSSIKKNQIPTIIGEFHEDLVNKKLAEFLQLFSHTAQFSQISKKRYIVELIR
ncbi:MAG: FkbM family methyltransferase [Minisyncoccia bacterium]